jgi:hypothetical protein
MYKYVLIAAVTTCSGVSGCATEEPAATMSPPEPTRTTTRWASDYRTGSRLPLQDYRVGATVQPVYQFDAVEYARERPPMGDHRGP